MIKTNVDKALVIIPHEDDEINLMGGLIPLLCDHGVELHFVFLTNGDAIFDGKVRIKETINALKVLGIQPENVYFLGYLDSNNTAVNCLYKSDNVLETRYGHQTYGDVENPDYAFRYLGVHSDYNYSNLKRDLKDCILRIRPEVIFATDFDSHLDHRICSMVFEEVMSEILLDKNTNFYPYIYKGFAYSTAFSSVKDFYSINIKDTVKPTPENLARNTLTELDNPAYDWATRVQFPVDKRTATSVLYNNILYKALREHVSQCIGLQGKKILNADKCFWERPTLNFIYSGSISASSSEIERLLDFRLFDVKNIYERIEPLEFEWLGWTPEKNDIYRTLKIKFTQNVRVRWLNLYVHTSVDTVLPNIKVLIDNKLNLTLEDFDNGKYKYSYSFGETIDISNIMLKIISQDTTLLFIEILPEHQLPMEFAKIKINGNFSYKYYLDKNRDMFDYEVCTYGINRKELKCYCDNKCVNIGNGVCYVPKSLRNFTIKVINENTGEVYDEVLVVRLSYLEKVKKYLQMIFDHVYVNFIHKVQKIKRHKLKHKINN